MRLVVDANIFVAELIRKRGRVLIAWPKLELYMTEVAWSEACHELNKRLSIMVQRGVFSQEAGQRLLADALALAEAVVSLIPHEVYTNLEVTARDRISRDPDDWPTVALALVLEAAIWTSDGDFLGCGLPTWTTETLLLCFAAEREQEAAEVFGEAVREALNHIVKVLFSAAGTTAPGFEGKVLQLRQGVDINEIGFSETLGKILSEVGISKALQFLENQPNADRQAIYDAVYGAVYDAAYAYLSARFVVPSDEPKG